MTLNRECGERQCSCTDEPQPISLPRLNINHTQTRITRCPICTSPSLPIDQNCRSLTTPHERIMNQPFLDSLKVIGERILDKDNLLVVVIIRNVDVVHNQRASGRYGLEADVTMVEVCTCHANGDVNLVVEEMCRWDRPLGGERCAVAERGDGH